MKQLNNKPKTDINDYKSLIINILPPPIGFRKILHNLYGSLCGKATTDSLPPTGVSTTNPEKAERRRQNRLNLKLLYGNTDDDFQIGEIVRGRIIGFHSTKKKHLQYVLVDTDDGRHTRVHVRSFDISGISGLNTDLLHKGDSITLRKTGYNVDRHNTYWHVESVPLAALIKAGHPID